MRLLAVMAMVVFGPGCASGPPRPGPPPAPPAEPIVELVESAPIETTLAHPDIADAFAVWPAMFGRARRTIDIAQFYVSNQAGSRLEPAIVALEAAAARGVRVRFVADAAFAGVYPETLERLDGRPGITVRRLDASATMGGVQHAKYFIVDRVDAYLGSQNFDWRSLTHIQELGVRIRDPGVARAIEDVFETDWLTAGGTPLARVRPPQGGYRFPSGVTAVFSPRGHLPDELLWDLPRLQTLLDGARRSVQVQLLTYAADEHGVGWDELEAPLRRAAARGVRVELLVSDWCKRPGVIEGLARLHAPPGLTVRLVTIPPWSGGFVPYARVVHSKFLVVDGQRAWVGTSNWERDYFYRSRNVGLILEQPPIGQRLAALFRDLWTSPYAETLDPTAAYVPPRIAE